MRYPAAKFSYPPVMRQQRSAMALDVKRSSRQHSKRKGGCSDSRPTVAIYQISE